MMTVLFGCSTIYCVGNNEPDSIPPLPSSDSVKVSYDDLRKVNTKLIDLKYTKEENTVLRSIVQNDSVIISNYENVTNNLMKSTAKLKRQRNIGFGVGIAGLVLGILVNLIK